MTLVGGLIFSETVQRATNTRERKNNNKTSKKRYAQRGLQKGDTRSHPTAVGASPTSWILKGHNLWKERDKEGSGIPEVAGSGRNGEVYIPL